MDALSATTVSANSAVTAVQLPHAEPAPAAPAPAPPLPHAEVEVLPALPAAVQRTQLQAPEPKLMTREQMAALLALTT